MELNMIFFVGDQYDGAGFILQPVLTLEPRYYYNLENRNSEEKTSKIVVIFFFKNKLSSDWFVLNLDENITKTADLSIIPTWGLIK
jgi:hypothetical protein